MTLVWVLLLFLALPEIKRFFLSQMYKADRTNNLMFIPKMEYFDKDVSNLKTGFFHFLQELVI